LPVERRSAHHGRLPRRRLAHRAESDLRVGAVTGVSRQPRLHARVQSGARRRPGVRARRRVLSGHGSTVEPVAARRAGPYALRHCGGRAQGLVAELRRWPRPDACDRRLDRQGDHRDLVRLAMDAALEKLSERVNETTASKRALRLRGGGSKDFYGQALEGELLDPRAYSGIVAYEPSELVITARCGTALAEVEAAMRERGQQLAFEPPHYGAATVGGAVAAGLSGPGRQSAGALRDFVLGTTGMDWRGQVLSLGGAVRGEGGSRVMAGSRGPLGIILEVSLKALPLPVAEATVRLELPEARAIEQLNRWGGKPLPISASAWNDGAVTIRLSGAAAAVREACAKIGGVKVEDAQAVKFWNGIREQTDRFFGNDGPLWRISVPPAAPPLKLQ